MKLLIIWALLCGIALAQEPQLKMRPAVPVESMRPDPKPKHHRWMKRVLKIGVGLAVAKIADDSVDNPGVLGPRKAMLVGAGAFGLTEGIWWLVSERK